MYEEKQNIAEIIMCIILMIVVFVIFPLACSNNSSPKYFDQMDGTEDPYWSP